MEERGLFSRFFGVDVAVESIDDALFIFRDCLGLQQFGPITSGDEGSGYRWVRLGLNGQPFMSLLDSPGPGPVRRFLERHGEGLYQLTLETPDLESTTQALRQEGIEILEPAHSNEAGSLFVHPRSACGVLVELMQQSSD